MLRKSIFQPGDIACMLGIHTVIDYYCFIMAVPSRLGKKFVSLYAKSGRAAPTYTRNSDHIV